MKLKDEARRASKVVAKANASKFSKASAAFTAHGSKFARRQEESAYSAETSRDATTFQMPQKPVEDKPSRFERYQQAKKERESRDDTHQLSTKQEKFQEVIAESRREKYAHQMRREGIRDQTAALDEEFAGISHLLKQRNRAEEAKEAFNNPADKTVLDQWEKEKTQRSSKAMVIGADGNLTKEKSDDANGSAVSFELDEASKKLLAQVRASAPKVESLPSATEADLSFDRMMAGMRSASTHASATQRSKTEEELAREKDLAELKELAARQPLELQGGDEDLLRREIIAQGGEGAFDMHSDDGMADDDEEEEEGDAKPTDDIFLELLAHGESLFHKGKTPTPAECSDFLRRFWEQTKRRATTAASVLRNFLSDAEHTKDERPFTRFMLYAITKVFPPSDLRHPVLAPLRFLLCGRIARCSMKTTLQATTGLFFSSLLTHSLLTTVSSRFTSEVLMLALNVLLQAVSSSVASKVAIPHLARGEAPFWGLKIPTTTDATELDALDAFATEDPHPLVVMQAAYKLLLEWVKTFHSNAGADAIGQSCLSVLQVIGKPHPLLESVHQELLSSLKLSMSSAEQVRAPLAMRKFRPRPLRQFEPLLVESEEIREHKELKREVREDRKRVVRQLQAEASVIRRKRERELQDDDERRDANYKKLLGELQQQQHIMKTVDMFKAKAKSKKKKGISGDPTSVTTEGSAAAGGGGGGGGGGE